MCRDFTQSSFALKGQLLSVSLHREWCPDSTRLQDPRLTHLPPAFLMSPPCSILFILILVQCPYSRLSGALMITSSSLLGVVGMAGKLLLLTSMLLLVSLVTGSP